MRSTLVFNTLALNPELIPTPQNEPTSLKTNNGEPFDLNSWRAKNSAQNIAMDTAINEMQSSYDARSTIVEDQANAIDFKLSQNPKYNGEMPCQDVQSRLTAKLTENDLDGVKDIARELKICMRDDLRSKAAAM